MRQSLRVTSISIARQLSLALFLTLFIAGLVLVPGAAAQGDSAQQLTVIAPALNVRSGPGVTYPALATLLQGDQLPVTSFDAASGWWQIQLPGGATGWVSGGPTYVTVTGNLPSSPPSSAPSAAFSVGQTLVFQASSGGPIYAINTDGTNLRYLTTGTDPALSPDGQWVAFTRWNTSQDGALGNVWVIKIDGSDERVVNENLFNPRTPAWSADGTKLVISMQHGGQPQAEHTCGDQRPPRGSYDISVLRDGDKVKFCYTTPPDPHWGLRLIDVATGSHEDLKGDTYSFSPTWNPNNSLNIIYDGNTGDGTAGLINLDLAQNKTWALTNDFNDHSPDYSPDGSKIAVSYRQDDHWEVHVMNSDGSGRVRLTQTSYQTLVEQELSGQQPHSYSNAAPAWSPDSSQIAFLTNRTGPWEIWVMNADGSNQRPMFPPELLASIPLQYNGVDEQMLSWR